jgi:hypothetical protein
VTDKNTAEALKGLNKSVNPDIRPISRRDLRAVVYAVGN